MDSITVNHDDNQQIINGIILDIINGSDTVISDIKEFSSPRIGYSGALYYREKGFQFTVSPDEEEQKIIFQVQFPFKTDSRFSNRVFMMTVLADTIIQDEGIILPTAEEGILLFKEISLLNPIVKNDIMRTMGSIVYAFSPYLFVIGNGRYPFRYYAGGSAIGKIVSKVIPPDDNNINNSDNWFDSCDYCEESWYQEFCGKYDQIYNTISKRLIFLDKN